ncbi:MULTISPECIES: MFS transporter [Rhizobium]|uniref:MFS-type transporter y4rN n=1 Tax=Rhizobium favelukesii TaxID=348824 RepID=W6RIP6_9HYPH|nr:MULTISPECIES: MFS transporter [Rhizobium]MCS0463648.1 MFS transporter [Rhizobium favelukesii]UFS84956.1 MFS transporter [Rhizobium sp. T136]CDM60190.1 putative MFS-type transporter y4rN [Rhizobium favelukesii]
MHQLSKRQGSYRDLLKIPGLFPLIVAATLSRLAGRMFVLTLVLFALAQFSSSTVAGWLTFAAIVPGLIVSPLAGVLLDRVGPTIAVRIDMIASAVFVVAISFVGWAGWSSPPTLFILVMLFSLTGPLGAAGTRILLPRLVPPGALDQANALDIAVYAIVDVVGPAMAGVVLVWLGPEAAMAVIAAAYAGAAICLPHVQHLPGSDPAHTSFLRQTIEGIQMVARQPTLRGLAVSYSLYEITWGALYVVVPVYVADHYATAAGDSVTGLLWAAMGIAGGLGALLAGHVRTTGRERGVMAAGMVVTAFAAWPVGAEFGFGGLAAGLVLAGVASGPINVALLTLRQRRTDPQQLGRVLSISISLNGAGFPLGSAIAGMVIPESLSATFVLAGVASVVAAIASVSIPSDTASAA